MKIRIQDNSIRYRLSLKEVEAFTVEGSIHRTTQVIGAEGLGPVFEYSLEHEENVSESLVLIEGSKITIRLSSTDRETLLKPEEEGVYLRRKWTSPDGHSHRFMAFVEKDRPGSTCIKPEAWVYDAPPGGPIETRPIPKKQKS